MPPIERLRPPDVDRLRRAGRVAAATLAAVRAAVRPGMSTADVDQLVRADTARRGARPSQLGYRGFPGAVCTSVGDVACHGIPRADVRLVVGDLLSIDVTSVIDGFHGDTCTTLIVGPEGPADDENGNDGIGSSAASHLLHTARRARDAGIAEVRPGARLGDIGAACDEVARQAGCRVVEEVGGHGIGRAMHLPPHVAHVGRRGRGLRLRPGMAITVEPILTLGDPTLREDADGWTLRIADGSLAAQFEHTVLVTHDGHEVMTEPPP